MVRYFEGVGEPPGGRIGIVVSRYNRQVTERLLEGALKTLADQHVPPDQIDVAWVPGAWEIPVVARHLARQSTYHAVICLGAVIRGETSHDQYINQQVSLSLGQLAVQYGKPVTFGVLTCHNLEQALQRSGGGMGNKGSESALAALQTAGLLAKLPDQVVDL